MDLKQINMAENMHMVTESEKINKIMQKVDQFKDALLHFKKRSQKTSRKQTGTEFNQLEIDKIFKANGSVK